MMPIEDTTSLRRIVYRSLQASDLHTNSIVDLIALPAMRKNRLLGITGCLWFDRAHFIQILEGPSGVVADVYDAILRDNRHNDVETLLDDAPASRHFARFSMRTVTSGIDKPISKTLIYKPGTGDGSEFQTILTDLIDSLRDIVPVDH